MLLKITGPLALTAFVAFGACTHVPFDAPKTVSRAVSADPAEHAQSPVAKAVASNPGRAAVVPLPDGNDAFGARLQLIDDAKRAIDLQYFLIKPDEAGALLTTRLLRAADRGVRVRFLFDDALTTAKDRELALLDQHPNIELRVFNPLSRYSPTAVNYLLDFGRVNRRMHNKSLTVDGAQAIVGGRNVANEYFQINTSSEFADFDLYLAGPQVAQIGEAFDLYWNDPMAVPLANLHPGVRYDDLQETEAEIRAEAEQATAGIYARAVGSDYLDDVSVGRLVARTVPVTVEVDPPEKLRVPVPEGERRLAEALLRRMAAAESEVILLTPYFVPEDWGARFFRQLAERGVRVRIVTNSLASTNHPYVHAGYKRHRPALLASGVELYEVRADAMSVLGEVPEGADISLTMHTKIAVIDREDVFVGSMNFDPRSIKLNSEFGVFLTDRQVAGRLTDSLREALDDYTYKVSLAEDGSLQWAYLGAGGNELRRTEPDASGWRKFLAGVTALLPVEGQL
ncbi:putative cardiolipin synthase [Aliiruegeria haliotis]|uniref:Phospholipase D n=1 Tax=Aliiruegeria haliotis TaxID=1280846 RepID=A0A2T0RXZ7_9RHOB|nr:phospholipase D family protein [Aliiruegeria haliotis]PRY26055.1 putative cardiolipin synthase [Aliiruegeria haliotis]